MWQDFLFTITHDRVYIVYCIKQEEYWICCVEDTYTGFLQSWQDFFIITRGRIYNVYCMKQEEYRYVAWKVRIQVLMLVVELPFCHNTSQYIVA